MRGPYFYFCVLFGQTTARQRIRVGFRRSRERSGAAVAVAVAGEASATEAGRVCVRAACTLVRCKRHTAFPEAAGMDPVQNRLRLRSPDDRMLGLDGRDPSDRATWDGTGSGAEALYGQYVRVPEGVALPAHLRDCPGCCVQLQAGDDIVAACQLTFAADIRAHATRLGLSDEDRERIVALNMAACIAVCGFFSMAAGDRVRITRMECYGGDLEESASNDTHRESVKTALYNAMSPGHLYLQRYGHPGGADWGMSLRGAGRGKLLVRAVELGAGRELGGTEMGMSAWAKKSGARRTSSSRRMRLRSTHLRATYSAR